MSENQINPANSAQAKAGDQTVKSIGRTTQTESSSVKSSEAKQVLKPLDNPAPKKGNNMEKKNKIALIFSALVVVLFGVGTGYFLVMMQNGGGTTAGLKKEAGLKREVSKEEITVGTKVGIADESTFKDSAEGELEKGGIDGEGSHHLVRPGGEDQTLYMTSSVIDLDQFVGRKVKVWGETFSAQHAGWLMDVGKLEVLE